MKFQHQSLASGRWFTFPLMFQLASVGTDFDRALIWRAKGDERNAEGAMHRALELIELTIMDPRHRKRLKELCRLKEFMIDYFYGVNEYGSTPESWRSYFRPYEFAAAHWRANQSKPERSA